MTKQTSANNKALAKIKKIYNEKIYKGASTVLNTLGEDAMWKYMQSYHREGVDAKQSIMSWEI